MKTLRDVVPDVEVLLALPPEELAPILLRLVRDRLENTMFHPNNFASTVVGTGMSATDVPCYPAHRAQEVETVLSEGWQWLRVNLLIVPAPGMNGTSGWMVFSRRGAVLAAGGEEDFARFRAAAAFPKSLLHPSIADKVWLALARGDLDEAVFAAFKAVEESVRRAGSFGAADIGVPLMRKAFEKTTGPLTDSSQPEAEREALAHLFAGAIGSYKNPHSHRTVSITDPGEAQEMAVLASHLLRIVESRQKLRAEQQGGTGGSGT